MKYIFLGKNEIYIFLGKYSAVFSFNLRIFFSGPNSPVWPQAWSRRRAVFGSCSWLWQSTHQPSSSVLALKWQHQVGIALYHLKKIYLRCVDAISCVKHNNVFENPQLESLLSLCWTILCAFGLFIHISFLS